MPDFCPQCHAPLKDGAQFCSKCGAKTTTPVSQGAPRATFSRESEPQTGGERPQVASAQSARNRQFSLWFLGLLILLLAWSFIHRLISGPPVGFGAYGDTSGAASRYYLDSYPILYVPVIALFIWLFVRVARNSPPRE